MIHTSITPERVGEAIERSLKTTDNPGFCLACGEEVEGCEPDARNYECEFCGCTEVFGAAEILISFLGEGAMRLTGAAAKDREDDMTKDRFSTSGWARN